MSFYSIQNALELALLIQYHDANCRHDLNQGFITSERDYVSHLATHLRYPAGSLLNSRIPAANGLLLSTFDGPVTSLTLPPSFEQELGFDGVIILALPCSNSEVIQYKIGLFEAKWPRMFGGHQHLYPTKTGNTDNWDKKPAKKPSKPSPSSHFSHQLIRQHRHSNTGLVLWEQFFSEASLGTLEPHFRKYGSTCVFHEAAYEFMRASPYLNPANAATHTRWKRADLTALFSSTQPLSLARIIFGMASCELGQPFIGDRNSVRIPPPASLSPDELIPIAERTANFFSNGLAFRLPTEDLASIAAIHQMMRNYGLTSYTHVTLSEEGASRAHTWARQSSIDEILREL